MRDHNPLNIPKPERPNNPSPLELAIYNYEVKAREFHIEKAKIATDDEPASGKKLRILKSERDWEHLRLERRKIAAHIMLQEELVEYRTSNKSKSVKELSKESHHPTGKLARNLTATGEPKPTVMHEPHHIIPGKGCHQKVEMAVARMNLHAHGIGINDPLNGVWLRNFAKNTPDDWATPDSPAHRPIHTYNYETWINERFSNDNLPESVFLSRLQTVKREIKSGTHPQKILQSKDTNWTGV